MNTMFAHVFNMPPQAMAAFQAANAALTNTVTAPTDDDCIDLQTCGSEALGALAKDCFERAETLRDNARADGRPLSDRDKRRIEKLEGDAETFLAEIERREGPPKPRTQTQGIASQRAANAADYRLGILLPARRPPAFSSGAVWSPCSL